MFFHKASWIWRTTTTQATTRASPYTALRSLKIRCNSVVFLEVTSRSISSSLGRLAKVEETSIQKASPQFLRKFDFQSTRKFSASTQITIAVTSSPKKKKEEGKETQLLKSELDHSQYSEFLSSDTIKEEHEDSTRLNHTNDKRNITETELNAIYEEMISILKGTSASKLGSSRKLKEVTEEMDVALFSTLEYKPFFKLMLQIQQAEGSGIKQQTSLIKQVLGEGHPPLHIFNMLIYFHSLKGHADKAFKVFNTIKEMGLVPNERSYHYLMNAYATQNNLKKTLEVLNLMQENKVPLSSFSYTIAAKAYAINGKVDEAFAMYEATKKEKMKVLQPLFSILIRACIKDNQIGRAWSVFNYMRKNYYEADVVTFTLMLNACAKTADAVKAIELFENMSQLGIVPNLNTFNALLNTLSTCPAHYEVIPSILDLMKTQFGIEPDAYTVTILLHAAQKKNRLEDSRKLFLKIIKATEGTRGYFMVHSTLFFAYATVLELPCKENRFSTSKYFGTGNNSLALPDLHSTLEGPVPNSYDSVIDEARLVMWHMERAVVDPELAPHRQWARVSYLNVHINYCNFEEATRLFAIYFTACKIRPHFSLYINILNMCFCLKKTEYLETFWKEIEEFMAPLWTSTTSLPLEKLYNKDFGMDYKRLYKFYHVTINGFAEVQNLKMSFILLEYLVKDDKLLTRLDIKDYSKFKQAVLISENSRFIKRFHQLFSLKNNLRSHTNRQSTKK